MDKNLSLREIREKLGLTQQELADSLGMVRAYISAVERGASPFSEKFRKRVENLSFPQNARDITANGNVGPVTIQSPGAQVHGTSVPANEVPPTWVVELQTRLNTRLDALEAQGAEVHALLFSIQALLIKLTSK